MQDSAVSTLTMITQKLLMVNHNGLGWALYFSAPSFPSTALISSLSQRMADEVNMTCMHPWSPSMKASVKAAVLMLHQETLLKLPVSLHTHYTSGCRGRPLSTGWMCSRVLNRKTISLPASGIQIVNRKVNRQMWTSCAAINTRSSPEGAIPPSVFETTFSVLCSRTSKHIFVSLLQCHQHTFLFPVLFIAVHFSKMILCLNQEDGWLLPTNDRGWHQANARYKNTEQEKPCSTVFY